MRPTVLLLLAIIIATFCFSHSSTEVVIITNGRTNCPAANSSLYQWIPYEVNEQNAHTTPSTANVTTFPLTSRLHAISVMHAESGRIIARFELPNVTFQFLSLTPQRPALCATCFEPMRLGSRCVNGQLSINGSRKNIFFKII